MGKHEKVARDCWRMISALASPEIGTPMSLKRVEDLEDAAIALIEMACDSAAESQRIADGHPPQSTIITWDKDGNRIVRQKQPSITCPRCGMTSYHPKDISERYCGACHQFHEPEKP